MEGRRPEANRPGAAGCSDPARGEGTPGPDDRNVSTVDTTFRRALLQVIAAHVEADSKQLSADQWEREFNECLDSLPTMLTLSDEAIPASTRGRLVGDGCAVLLIRMSRSEVLAVTILVT